MRLILLHPEVAARDCADCQQWLYHDKPGEFGGRVERQGKPVARGPRGKPPCSMCPKQPADVPERERTPATAIELTEGNWQTVRFYQECRAIGRFPNDALVRRDAAVIRRVEDAVASVRQLNAAVIGGRAGRE